MAITLERNEISSPNWVHVCTRSVFGKIEKKLAVLPLGGAIIWKKHKNEYNFATAGLIDLKIGMQCLCPMWHKCI